MEDVPLDEEEPAGGALDDELSVPPLDEELPDEELPPGVEPPDDEDPPGEELPLDEEPLEGALDELPGGDEEELELGAPDEDELELGALDENELELGVLEELEPGPGDEELELGAGVLDEELDGPPVSGGVLDEEELPDGSGEDDDPDGPSAEEELETADEELTGGAALEPGGDDELPSPSGSGCMGLGTHPARPAAPARRALPLNRSRKSRRLARVSA